MTWWAIDPASSQVFYLETSQIVLREKIWGSQGAALDIEKKPL
jgi:hypothetical protein